MYSVTPSLNRRLVFFPLATGACGASAVPVLLERQRGGRARQLALRERQLAGPGVREQLHVREVPVVILDPHAGGPSFDAACAFEPADELVGRFLRRATAAASAGCGAAWSRSCARRSAAVLGVDSQPPQVARVPGQVAGALAAATLELARDVPRARRPGFPEGEPPTEQLDGAVGEGALPRRLIALVATTVT